MARYGLLIDYEFCFGCHACELACKQEHDFPVGKFGIKVAQSGPMQIDEDRWCFDYVPIPTDLCDFCQDRVKKGKQPSCVKHCQGGVMKFGTLDELAKYMELKPKLALFTPKAGLDTSGIAQRKKEGDGRA